ncbi:SNF2 family N-terminal domain-containing protein [Hyaloraphidium curvatum]|nr:SNF2 family N-terminal domain-containing protein [Hyaloraphidium curvatum]
MRPVHQVWSAVDLSVRYDRKAKTKREASSQPPALTTKLLPFQLEGLAWMRQQEDSAFKGGILADEMGMGKTIQTIALLVAQERLGPNLILTPTVALLQWNEEILKHTLPGTLKVMVYHGSDRPATAEELTSCDVVLSTYSIVESSHRKQHYGFRRKGQLVKEKSLLHSIAFDRIVLDEAHSIKDRSCSTARAVFALQCDKKWCLSGTPLQNRVGELYSLLRFLKCDPFAYYFCSGCSCKSLSWAFSDRRNCDDCGHKPMAHFCWWNREILKPIQNYGGEQEDGQVAFRKLSHLLDKIMLRRTKLERAADLGLPPRVVIVRRDYFGEEEEDLYNSLYGDAKRKFDTYVAEDRVLNNYANIFELLMRMRQASNHPDLVTKKALVSGNQKVNALVCGICHEPAEDAVVSSCKHTFCREDVSQYMEGCADPTPKCPVCFRNLNIDLSQPGVQLSDAAEADKKMRASIVNYLDFSRWRSSTKIEALVEELQNLRSNDATVKAICFSQFTNFLDLVHWRLQRSGFTCVKLDGRMSPQQRANIITAFNTDPKITVFLISLKAGGIALNLTEASAVFMLDPWWNPAVEDQAMDRIHRLGQHRPIKITRIIIENSIESRILQLQEKKKLLFESTVGKDMDALAKLTEDDLKVRLWPRPP